jgi:hypothetical protein
MRRWDVIALLVSKINALDAGPFQAPELKFYGLHARLWLLIALSRVVMDFPRQVSQYAEMVKTIAFDKSFPHALIQHFSVKFLDVCQRQKSIRLNLQEKALLKAVNKSSFPPTQRKERGHWYDLWNRGRPEGALKPADAFGLDYDFHKGNVNWLCRVFDKEGWEVDDIITAWVRKYDTEIKGMYDNGGRERPGRRDAWEMTPKYHIYGEYLGWHGLFLAAGTLLSQQPVVGERGENAWNDWLSQELLTRQDGLWLADGTDSPPLDTLVNLLEQGAKELEVTGDREKILKLVGIVSDTIGDEIVVEGHWKSYDGIDVSISSALVPTGRGGSRAENISKQNPHDVWFPDYHIYGNEGEYVRNAIRDYEAWIVSPSVTAKLDEQDPLGSPQAVIRPYICEQIRRLFNLNAADPFNRVWKGIDRDLYCTAEAWGRGPSTDDDHLPCGNRLKCSKKLLREILRIKSDELLITVKLRRYQEGFRATDGKFHHTTAVLRVTKNVIYTYYRACPSGCGPMLAGLRSCWEGNMAG